jgi:hypothetical protein
MSECTGCGSGGTKPHTTDCLFGHFIDYQNWRELSWATKKLLRVAYEHGMREGAKQSYGAERKDDNCAHEFEPYYHGVLICKKCNTVVSEAEQS